MGGMPCPIIISTGDASETVPPVSTIMDLGVVERGAVDVRGVRPEQTTLAELLDLPVLPVAPLRRAS